MTKGYITPRNFLVIPARIDSSAQIIKQLKSWQNRWRNSKLCLELVHWNADRRKMKCLKFYLVLKCGFCWKFSFFNVSFSSLNAISIKFIWWIMLGKVTKLFEIVQLPFYLCSTPSVIIFICDERQSLWWKLVIVFDVLISVFGTFLHEQLIILTAISLEYFSYMVWFACITVSEIKDSQHCQFIHFHILQLKCKHELDLGINC